MTVQYLKSEQDLQIERMKNLGINTDGQIFEQCVNTLLQIVEDTVLKWWNNLPIQNIEDPSDGWSGYCMKYYPEKTNCCALTNDEIIYIWRKEHIIA